MANGTLKVSNIQTSSGSGTITIGQSGETISIPSGCTITNSGTQTGFGGVNTPAFQATLSSSQSISNSTATKVQLDSEIFDSDGTYDNSSNYRFTPAVAGKYHVTAKVNYADASADDKYEEVYIYKNGSSVHSHRTRTVGSTGRDKSTEVNAIVDLDADDYVEVYTQHNAGSSVNINGGSNQCLFQAFKLVE